MKSAAEYTRVIVLETQVLIAFPREKVIVEMGSLAVLICSLLQAKAWNPLKATPTPNKMDNC